MTTLSYLRQRRRTQGRRRGASVFLFMGVVLPALLLGGAIAVDTTMLVTAQRQVSNATTMAAAHGVNQIQLGTTWLASDADEKAEDHVLLADRGAGIIPPTLTRSQLTGVNANLSQCSGPRCRRIDVTVSYTVDNLIFLDTLANLFGSTTDVGFPRPITRSAEICIPGRAGVTDGFCQRPR